MFKKPPSRITAILLAFMVMLLWSTSWVLIKLGKDILPLTYSGVRYGLGFLILAPFLLKKEEIASLKNLTKSDWWIIILLGVFSIAILQGAQYIGLSLLPAVTVNLIMQLTPLIVTFGGLAALKEYPSWLQWIGVGLNLAGVLIYFFPMGLAKNQAIGIAIVAIGLLANAATTILGRRINKAHKVSPLAVTALSMGLGSAMLLLTGLITEPRVIFSGANLGITAWLALVNTALAFTLWNYTQQTLKAIESSMIVNAMIIFVAISAAIFLHEQPDTREIIGLIVAGTGSVLVQLNGRWANRRSDTSTESIPQ